MATPAVATTVGEAEVRVRRRRLAGPAAGGVTGRGTGGCSVGRGSRRTRGGGGDDVSGGGDDGGGSGSRSGGDGDKGTVLTLGGGG